MDARVRVALGIGVAIVGAALAGGAAFALVPRDSAGVVQEVPGIEVTTPATTPSDPAPAPPAPEPVPPAPPADVDDDADDGDDDD